MAFWKAIVLGIIQGLTEFLPVSSSGHLVLGQYFLGIEEPQLFFDIMLHVGTLGAIIVVFQRDIRDIFAAIVGREPSSHRMTRRSRRTFAWLIGVQSVAAAIVATIFSVFVEKLSLRKTRDVLGAITGREPSSHRMTRRSGRIFVLLVLVGLVPTVIIALIFNMFVEKLFAIPLFVSGMLLATGTILWLPKILGSEFQPSARNSNELAGRSTMGLNVIKALMIGAAQGVATLPGISRSGITISVALMRGVDGQEAARYSMLLSVPAIIGATLLKLKDVANVDISVWTIIAGALTAFMVGYYAITFLLRTLGGGRFSRFAYYCWGVGAISALGYGIKAWIG